MWGKQTNPAHKFPIFDEDISERVVSLIKVHMYCGKLQIKQVLRV